jgi:hypothetical protein
LDYSKEELEAYTEQRLTGIAEDTINWIKIASETFWQQTQGMISHKAIRDLYNYTLGRWDSRDSWSKVLNFAKSFLEYLAKTRFDQRYLNFQLFLDMPKAIKERKRTTDRAITKNDIKNVIKTIVQAWKDGRLDYRRALDFVCQAIFGAYTGQRSKSTIARLRVDQFQEALKPKYPVILVEAQQDKIRMEHYVPLHPAMIPFIKALMKIKDGRMFEFMAYQQWLKRNHVPLERADLIKNPDRRHFVTGDLRKFAEQIGDIIKWDLSNRAYILTHNVSSIDWERYKHPLPEFVYQIYIESWRDVDLVPREAYELLNS